MPSRWLSIILVVMIGAQILVAGCALMLIGNELATAMLCQDHLREQIYAASRRKWDFRRKGGKKWQRRSRGKGRGRPREKPPKDGESAWWAEPVASVPKLNLAAQDVEQWAEELQDYHDLYRPLFQRREQREWSALYLRGLLSDVPKNKSIESMMLSLHGAEANAIRDMQHFISQGAWADEPILTRHQSQVNQTLAEEDGVYILDGSDFLKQGEETVGVNRQWCGEAGKVANCVAGVFLGYASRQGYTLLDRRLYLPEKWVIDEAYAESRQRTGIPDETEFKTKPKLGTEMLQGLYDAGVLQGCWLAADEAFGRDTAFLDRVDELGLWYFAEVPHDTRAWTQRPATHVPEGSGRGRKPTRERLVEGECDAQQVVALAAFLPSDRWSRHLIKEGSKGPIIADFAVLRVVAVRDSLPGPQVWLVLRRHVETGELKTYLSNAPAQITFQALVRLSGMRWPIETCFEESKQHLGMGDFQIRSWRGWHHHMTLCILAHFFLVLIQLNLRNKAPVLTLPQIVLIVASVLPTRTRNALWALEVVTYRQQRNHAAYLSHRKRRLALLALIE
jgi:SRSO17 transposase